MRDAAKIAGFNQSAFTRWKNGGGADPEFVIKFARAFDLNVLEALVEAEFITEEEASLNEINIGGLLLEEASNEQLAREFLHRLESQADVQRRLYAVADSSDDEEEGNPGDYND